MRNVRVGREEPKSSVEKQKVSRVEGEEQTDRGRENHQEEIWS